MAQVTKWSGVAVAVVCPRHGSGRHCDQQASPGVVYTGTDPVNGDFVVLTVAPPGQWPRFPRGQRQWRRKHVRA